VGERPRISPADDLLQIPAISYIVFSGMQRLLQSIWLLAHAKERRTDVMKVKDIMTTDVMTCKETDTLSDCTAMMKEFNIGAIPVMDDGDHLVGIITDRDIAVRAVAKGIDPDEAHIGDFMTPSPVTIEPEINIEDAADIMAANQIRRLPVVDNGKLVGIVSIGDLAVNIEDIDVIAETLRNVSLPSR